MVLTQEQLEVLDSCPALQALKPWIIAVDESVLPNETQEGTVEDEDAA